MLGERERIGGLGDAAQFFGAVERRRIGDARAAIQADREKVVFVAHWGELSALDLVGREAHFLVRPVLFRSRLVLAGDVEDGGLVFGHWVAPLVIFIKSRSTSKSIVSPRSCSNSSNFRSRKHFCKNLCMA